MTGRSCTRLQAVSSYGSFTIATSLIFLAIERICATVWFKSYENGGYRKLGIVLSVSQWIMSIPALPFLGEVNTRYPYCQSAVVRPRASQYFMACMLIAQITGLVIFVILVIVNKRKMSRYFFNSALKLLSVRYQLRENIGTTKLMIPISIASAFLYAISLIIIIVLLEDLPDNAQLTTKIAQKMISFARWREMIGFAIPLHTFALCTVVVCYSSHIRQATIKLIGWNRRTIATSKSGRTDPTARNTNVEAEQTKKRYFDALKMQWESVNVSNQSKQQQCSLDVMASRKSHGSQKIAWDPQDTQL
uniref:G-protein coupled receptors family 1 profile domain-containing protein n=1 Tax=Plectus sambesii TaxID=2011161 RepID=A0A914WRD7_9BILA